MTAVTIESELAENGYKVVSSVLSTEEVARVRVEVDDALKRSGLVKGGGQVLPNAASEAPDMGWLFAHKRILAAARSGLGTEELTFTMEADLHRNYLAGAWHKDTGEQVIPGGYFGVPSVGRPDCRVVKVALYLQDHVDGTGLHVRERSHQAEDLVTGQEDALVTRAGDAVLFDVRITHRGVQPTEVDLMIGRVARLVPSGYRDRTALAGRSLKRRLSNTKDRYAVYFAFGIPNEMTVAFAQRNMNRQLAQLGRVDPGLSSDLRQAFAVEKVGTVDLGG